MFQCDYVAVKQLYRALCTPDLLINVGFTSARQVGDRMPGSHCFVSYSVNQA